MKQKHLLLSLLSLLLAVPFNAMADDAVEATCAQVIAGQDGTVYRVKGKCTNIKNTKYGNWYLQDETGEIFIYGTNDKEGKKSANPMDSWGIEVGDIVTVEGPKTTYNGTTELVDVTVIDIKKGEPTEPTEPTATITDATVAEFNQAEVGDQLYRVTGVITEVKNASYGNVNIRDYSGTTYIYGIGSKGDFEAKGLKLGDIVTVVGKRADYKGTIEMTNGTCESFIPVTTVSIADFLTKEDSKEVYYMVTGTITNVATPTYGNLYLTDGENELYVYGCYPGWGATGDNRKGFLEKAGIQVGDELTMIGYKDTYKGTIELCGGIYFSHTSSTGISTAKAAGQTGVVYNLSGQRLQAPQKGINIVDGKKLLVK